MKIDVSSEIIFQTARSGGKGGQNVNKVETMVEGYFQITNSTLLTSVQKLRLQEKLANKINGDGYLQVRSQVHRSQLANKAEVVEKMNLLIEQALKKVKRRLPTKPTTASRQKRLEGKKKLGRIKEARRKPGFTE